MIKQYYEGIEWYDYLVFLIYNGIFTYLLYRLGDVFYSLQKKTVTIFLLLFQLYFFLVFTDTFFNFLPYLHNSELYSYMISSGQYPQTSPENLIVIYYLTLFIGLVCLNSPVIFTFFCIFITIHALMLFLKAWKKYFPFQSIYSESVFALLCFVWPAGILFTTAPFNESFVLLGFALFFSGFLKCIHEKKWAPFILGTIILCSFRFQLLVFALPVLAVLFISQLKIHKILKVTILASNIIIVFLFIRYIIVAGPLTPATLAGYRNMNLENAGPLAYGYVSWESYAAMCKDYFLLIAQFMFSPIPVFVQHNPLSTFIPFLDFIFILLLLILMLLNIKNIFRQYKALLLFILFYIILFGTYEYNLLGAVQHRMPLEVIFMLLVSNFLGQFITKTNLTNTV
jgi:hypothetical protein